MTGNVPMGSFSCKDSLMGLRGTAAELVGKGTSAAGVGCGACIVGVAVACGSGDAGAGCGVSTIGAAAVGVAVTGADSGAGFSGGVSAGFSSILAGAGEGAGGVSAGGVSVVAGLIFAVGAFSNAPSLKRMIIRRPTVVASVVSCEPPNHKVRMSSTIANMPAHRAVRQ